ncbi:hypothetical protein GMDG_07234 [Pseudogymnoascus destructans 20631-21]|uniref:CCHC-type domain-containing protein n=1 Tax=Pseudogymnoascus destructans (strain ATCC MYA-4855 / 20631-21) TaxID=658429 RepID=L8FXG7_PSED2|nr:hypothetical protein GMDG_07234 [Pseudogymnoascus destructans 20631-21]
MSKKPTSNIPQDNDGQLPRMTTRQTTAAAMTAGPSEDIPSRMDHIEAQIQEVKDLLVILSASQTRIPSTLLVDAPIPTVEVTEQRTPRTRNTPETVQLLPLRNIRSPSIPGSSRMHTEDPPNRYKKSTISEKILPLSDGVEHTFLQWSASIQDRLIVNEDHYLTDVSRRALIWGTTTGLAKTYLEPQYLSATHGFPSAEEMMDLLGSYYLTGNETEQARNLFNDLQMGEKGHASKTFPEFKARFQSAAITGQVSESEWFRYMWNKLTPQFCSREQRRNNELNPLPALARTSTRTTDTAKASASKPTRTTPALFTQTAFLPKLAIPERVRTAVPAPSGNCFKCGKPAHFQDKCPLNATVKEIDRNDPEAEEQWEEAVELQSDASLEENNEA